MMDHSARFNREWLSKKEYQLWLTPVEGDVTKAKCKICVKTFLLSNMGEIAVRSHVSGSCNKFQHQVTLPHSDQLYRMIS